MYMENNLDNNNIKCTPQYNNRIKQYPVSPNNVASRNKKVIFPNKFLGKTYQIKLNNDISQGPINNIDTKINMMLNILYKGNSSAKKSIRKTNLK